MHFDIQVHLHCELNHDPLHGKGMSKLLALLEVVS